ncbi:MAG TPA: RNA polymerase sigma-70 factor [Bacteroidales bacterium]|nr:RNA polymerase sigma-70 factor [Bacteroidales bacterium]
MDVITSDTELVSRLKKDDAGAFDMLYSRYSVNLYRFAFKYLKTKEDAEELVQAVFIKIWEIRRSLRPESSFKSFLYTIVYNEICNLFRKRKHNEEFAKETIYMNSKFLNQEIEERIDFKLLLGKVDKIIEKLPERQRMIFLKSRAEGKSTKEIAEEVGLSPGTVDNYISESIRFIKTKLKSESIF